MSETICEPVIVPIVPAKRCPDFDEDCADVRDHFACWQGWDEIPPADGYCPYVLRMLP